MWWITLSLVLAGLVFMLVEFLLVPGVGIAGIFSLGSLIGACYYTFDKIGDTAGWIVTIVVVALVAVSLVIILRAKTWKRFELQTEVTSRVNAESEKVSVGDRGIAQTRLAPRGTGRFGAVAVEVKSEDNSMIAAGTAIEVTRLEDRQVIVKSIKQQ